MDVDRSFCWWAGGGRAQLLIGIIENSFVKTKSFLRNSIWKDIFSFFFLFTLFCLKWSSKRVVQICSSFSLSLSLSLFLIYSQIECCIINNGYGKGERKGRRWGCWLFPFFSRSEMTSTFWEKGGGFILHRQTASRPFWLNDAQEVKENTERKMQSRTSLLEAPPSLKAISQTIVFSLDYTFNL